MATPIKVTPVLKGEDSKSFNNTLSSNLNNKISKEDMERILNTVNSVINKPHDLPLSGIKRGGFRKIDNPKEKKPCSSPSHNPPNMIVLPAGIYEYTCPTCGEVQIVTESKTNL